MKTVWVAVMALTFVAGHASSVHAQARPPLWFEAVTTTPRDKEINAKVIERLSVAFDVKTTIGEPTPRNGVQLQLYSQGSNTSVAILLASPRPPISIFRNLTVGSCNGSSTDSCADMIVNTIYKVAPLWNTVPAYPAGS